MKAFVSLKPGFTGDDTPIELERSLSPYEVVHVDAHAISSSRTTPRRQGPSESRSRMYQGQVTPSRGGIAAVRVVLGVRVRWWPGLVGRRL